MDLEEHTLPPSLEHECSVCGTELSEGEIKASREAGGPFLCSAHAAEEVPLAEQEETTGGEAGGADDAV